MLSRFNIELKASDGGLFKFLPIWDVDESPNGDEIFDDTFLELFESLSFWCLVFTSFMFTLSHVSLSELLDFLVKSSSFEFFRFILRFLFWPCFDPLSLS